MKNYRYVLGWSKQEVDNKIIQDSLDYAWRYTPSKNNFMNYSVFVLDPSKKELKESIYYKCLKQQAKSNGQEIHTQEELNNYEKWLFANDLVPQFLNIKETPYLLLYTHRVSKEINSYQKSNIEKGVVYEQTFPPGTRKYDAACQLSRIEIGMFAANFATKCLENNIDTSFTLCMPCELEYWSEPEWNFITDQPALIQLAGYGEKYRRPSVVAPDVDLKPNFDSVVKII